MKRFMIIAIVAMAVVALSTAAWAGGPAGSGKPMMFADGYLEGADFQVNWGPGSVNITVINKEKLAFDFSGLTTAGTAWSDDFAIGAGAGCVDVDNGYVNCCDSDCTDYNRLRIKFKNRGSCAVSVAVFMNTGFTNPNTSFCTDTGGLAGGGACDTYWQSAWTEVGAGKTKIVTLDFDNAAEAWNIADDPEHTGGINGNPAAMFRLDEVTHIGFQVADFSGVCSSTTLVVNPVP